MNNLSNLLNTTAKSLWRGSPRWRWASLGATALTILAIIANNLPPQTQQTPSSMPQPNTAGGQQAVQTGGQHQSATVPSSPINVVPAVDQKVGSRLVQFYTTATAAEKKTQAEGERCEGIVEAANILQEGDRTHAQSAQKDMIDKVDTCRPRLEDSNKRWAEVVTASNTAARDSSLHAARSFIDAIATLDAFDLSRSAVVRQKWPEKAQALKTAVATLEKDTATLDSLSLLYRPNDPASTTTADEIKAVYARLQSLPVIPKPEELSTSQKQSLEIAQRVVKDTKESDRRLSALDTAWQRHEADPTSLAAMLAELSAVDRERWDNGQGRSAKIKEMESTVSSLLPSVLDKLLASYEKERKREVAEQIIGMEAMAKRIDVSFSAESRTKMEMVRSHINESKQHLDRLVKAAQTWKSRPSGARDKSIEKEMLDAIAAVITSPGSIEVNLFDAAAMTPEQSRAFATLLAASVEIRGKLTAGQRPVGISIFLDTASLSDKVVAPITDFLREHLKKSGFDLSPQPNEAVIQLTVWDATVSQQGMDETTGQKKFLVSAKAKMALSYSGRNIDLGITTSTSHAPDGKDAIQAAENAVAETLAKVVLKKLGE